MLCSQFFLYRWCCCSAIACTNPMFNMRLNYWKKYLIQTTETYRSQFLIYMIKRSVRVIMACNKVRRLLQLSSSIFIYWIRKRQRNLFLHHLNMARVKHFSTSINFSCFFSPFQKNYYGVNSFTVCKLFSSSSLRVLILSAQPSSSDIKLPPISSLQ